MTKGNSDGGTEEREELELFTRIITMSKEELTLRLDIPALRDGQVAAIEAKATAENTNVLVTESGVIITRPAKSGGEVEITGSAS